MHLHRTVRRSATLAVSAGAGLLVAACGGGSSPTPSTSTGGSNAAITVAAANVSGLGTVLVNGDGRTLYILSSEQGGKLTCTDDNGCTKVWPDTELPSGVSSGVAGSGVDSSKLSTVKSAGGKLYLTYGGWPLYTYTGDSGTMQSHGQGITSFGGTWYALSTSGQPVTSPATSSNGY